MSNEASRQLKVAAALSGIGKPLIDVAAAAVAISGLASVFGWAFLKGYFAGVGAPWAVAMVDPVQFLTQAFGAFLALGTLIAVAVYTYIDSPGVSHRAQWQVVVVLFGAAVLCFALHFLLEKWVFESYQSHWGFIGGIVLVVSAMLFFGLIVQLIIEQFSVSRSLTAIWVVLFVMTFVGSLTPAFGKLYGSKQAENGRFVPVLMSPEAQPCEWGVVRALSQERVLLSTLDDPPAFKVVGVTDVYLFEGDQSNCRRLLHGAPARDERVNTSTGPDSELPQNPSTPLTNEIEGLRQLAA